MTGAIEHAVTTTEPKLRDVVGADDCPPPRSSAKQHKTSIRALIPVPATKGDSGGE